MIARAVFAAFLGATLGCAGERPAERAPAPRVAPTPPADAAADVSPAPDAGASASDCRPDERPITVADGERFPPVASSNTYPLRVPLLPAGEPERRAAILERHHPGFHFVVDDVGVVGRVATERAPCALLEDLGERGYATDGSVALARPWIEALAREIEVPFLADYTLDVTRSPSRKVEVLLVQSKPVARALTSLLPRELDDAALLAKWSGARVTWVKLKTIETVYPMPNPCLSHTGPMPCDPPGPRVTTRTVRVVLGSRPLGPSNVERIERSVSSVRDPRGLVLRRVADVRIDEEKLAADLFGKGGVVQLEMEHEVTVSESTRRDGVTGEALPQPSP